MKTSQPRDFSAIVFLPRVEAVYVNRKSFNLYSGNGLGIILENKDEVPQGEPHLAPAYHIAVLGVAVGKLVGLFAEIGYGVNGVLSIGIITNLGDEPDEDTTNTKQRHLKDAQSPCIRL